ncbi:MAG: hypothetical protein ACFFCE_11845 [Promethearchaeota archaeon]
MTLKANEVKILLAQKDKEEICPICGTRIEDDCYIYRHKAPSGYQCFKCGYYYFGTGI